MGGGGGGGEEREPGTDRSRMCLIYQHSDITVFLQYTFRISSASDIIRQITLPAP